MQASPSPPVRAKSLPVRIGSDCDRTSSAKDSSEDESRSVHSSDSNTARSSDVEANRSVAARVVSLYINDRSSSSNEPSAGSERATDRHSGVGVCDKFSTVFFSRDRFIIFSNKSFRFYVSSMFV